MSFKLEFEWKGIKELERTLSRAPPELRTLIHKRMEKKSGEVVLFAKHFVPVRTGYLRNTIYYRSIGFLQFLIEAYAYYAGFVEYGTSKIHARPYLRPAFHIATRTLKYELIQEIMKYFAKETRRLG